jgi:4-amino-4-deoxy-L-arabinose transferase-like glycosyltransferase
MQAYRIITEGNRNIHYLTGFLLLVVYVGCFFYPLMDKDAAHHANIALRMHEDGNYVNLIDRDKDYLDKPHLLFWATAACFKIFGVSTIAHRLPALLFSLLTLYSTYRLAAYLTNAKLAKTAIALLATAQAFVLSVSDARMESPLSAFIMFGTWQLIVYADHRKLISLILAALGAALAFSTKGWLGPVVIFIIVFFYIWLNRKWVVFSMPRTWLFIPFFFLFISPVLYAYYLQFDQHPEKVIRGKTGRSGLHFILWDQLFERSQGFDQGHSGRNSGYFFLFHTFLWAFFPWSLIAYGALVYWIKRVFKNRGVRTAFDFAALSFVFILVAISFSKFKMPHYIIMLLPLAALFTAPYLQFILAGRKASRFYYPFQVFFAVSVLLICTALDFYFFPVQNILLAAVIVLLMTGLLILLFSKSGNLAVKYLALGIAVSIVLNFSLFYNFFPSALKYQAGQQLVKQLEEKNISIPDSEIMLVELHAHSFDYYRGHNHRVIEAADFPEAYNSIGGKYFLLSAFLAKHIEKSGFRVEPVASQKDYNITTMKWEFLNPATREKNLDTLMLARVYRD